LRRSLWVSKWLRRSMFTLTRDAIVVDAERAGGRCGAGCDLEDRVAALELQVAPSGRGSRRPPIVKVGGAR
jgi:hypothetical protein